MKKVYLLEHTHDEGNINEDVKRIGIYDSYELAQEAQNRVKDQPGFIDYPDGFYIDEYIIDKDYWVDGFAT